MKPNIFEAVKSSNRTDKLNHYLELIMTETGDDYEIALNAAQHGEENGLRELVEVWFEDIDDPFEQAIIEAALDTVNWASLLDFILR